MRKLLLLLIALLSNWEVFAQVTTFMNAYKTPIWMTFANIDHSGDLLYLKSITQPEAGLNNFTCVIARFNTKTNTEVATITLLDIPGRAYSSTNISFYPAQNGIVSDNAGNLYVSVYSSDKVYRFDGPLPTSGNVTKSISYTYTLPSLSDSKPLALDLSGNLYIGKGTSLYKVSAASLETNATPSLFFNTPGVGISDIDFKDGSVYIAGSGTKLYKYSSKGVQQGVIEFNTAGTNIWSAEMTTDNLIYYVTGNNGAIISYNIENSSNDIFAGKPGTLGNQEDLSTTPPYGNARFSRLMNATLGKNGLMFTYDEVNSKVYKIVTSSIYEPGEPKDALGSPTGLVASAGNAKVNLNWTANNAADNITGYNVYRGTTANAVNTKINTSLVTSTTFTDETVVNNSTYYYAVTAVNADGESTKSTTVSATPTAPPVPQFTSTPVTEAIENVPYNYSLSAADGTNSQLTFTTPTLPDWLSLTQGQNTATQFGGTITRPGGIVGDANGNVYATELSGNKIYKIQPDGTTTPWFTRGAGNVYAMQIYQGYLYISYYSGSTGKITKVNLNDPTTGEIVVLPNVAGPLSIAIKDDYLYVALYWGGKVIKVNPTNNTYTDYVTVSSPFGLGFDQNGILNIASYNSGKVFKYNGTNLTEVLTGIPGASDIKIDKNDNLYVSSSSIGVRKYKPDLSSFIQVSTNTQVWGMSLTPSGSLLFGDYSGSKILKLETGAVLSGTPKHSDVGTHQVSVRVSNGTETADQSFTITVKDTTAPTVAISSSQASPAKEAFDVTFTFSEEVKDFALEDISATSATISNLQTQDNTTFTATVTPTADGEVSLQVKAGTLTDVNDNANTDSNEFKLLYDATAPTVVISSTTPAVLNKAFTVTFTFSEDVVGFTSEDATLTNATISAFTKVNNKTYTATITPTNNGTVSLAIAATKVQDNVGNDNISSEEFTRQYDATHPLVTVTTTAPNPTNAAFSVTFIFNEPVSDFSLTDISLVHVTASNLATVSATEYTALITPTAQGEVSVSVPENKTEDVATNGNEASNELKLIFDSIAPKGYAVTFNQEKIDFDNQTKVSVKVTGAETGADYFYEISSSGGGTPLTGTASASNGNFEILDLDVTVLKDGQITFAFYQQDLAGNKGSVVTDQVTKLTRNIVLVAQPATVQVPIRTTFLQVSLPASVEVTYTDNTTQQIAVTWQPGNYNAYIAGQYEVAGILTLAPGTSNQNNLQARIIIEVQPNKIPTALALSATTFNPNISASEAIGSFSTVDPDDQEFTYALVSGAGDTNNNLFEIRQNQLYLKSNQGLSGQTQFTIRVKTTDMYNNSFEQSFTLSKAAYAKSVDQLKIVNAFTPNGDGVNDEWAVPELKFYNKVSIEVFDRSGARLFQTTNPEKGWNGQNLNGKVLPGAYLYIIQVEDIKLTKKGVITVLKK